MEKNVILDWKLERYLLGELPTRPPTRTSRLRYLQL